MLKDENIIVTGGAGFIGYHICRQYLASNVNKLVIYDNLSFGRMSNITELSEEFPDKDIIFVEGDIMDLEKLTETMKSHKITLCNHHAAQLEITKCFSEPEYDINTNLLGTLNVLKAMVSSGVGRLINASSACVYGQNYDMLPSSEDYDKDPHWVYGMSKYAAEQLITIFCHDYDLKAVSFRYSIVMGTHEWYGRVGTLFIKRALNKEPLVIFGSGDQIRDIVDVSYAGLANFKVIDYLNMTPSGAHTPINISSAEPYNIITIAETVLEAVNGHVDSSNIVFEAVEEGDYSKLVEGRTRIKNELGVMLLDNTLMTYLLKIDINLSLLDTFKKEVAWIKDNPDAWVKFHI
jgi:UDP-glucose 4-epimerase